MDDKQVADLFERRAFPGASSPARLVSTHISWVILSPDYAFKIKKPVRFSFLDFSTTSLRAHYCKEEYRLNRRLAPDTYLGVLPIGWKDGDLHIGVRNRPAFDYAVWMRKEDNSRELDVLLRAGAVKAEDMKKLAYKLAAFHRQHTMRHRNIDMGVLIRDFSAIFSHNQALSHHLGTQVLAELNEMERTLPGIITSLKGRMNERSRAGFRVDGHGDLHSRNIFLTDDPILFDCIEFDARLRHLDVLDELAFLAMDLEFFKRPDLAEALLRFYTEKHACLITPEDEALFLYYKAYRANVRLKVTVLDTSHKTEKQEMMKQYWSLLSSYWLQLTKMVDSHLNEQRSD
ncbi:MAG: hypothetical protein KDC70_16400 [Saprospiraceae bacterium]|nr:hypothetical protein [Saprospiraceae bacterium]